MHACFMNVQSGSKLLLKIFSDGNLHQDKHFSFEESVWTHLFEQRYKMSRLSRIWIFIRKFNE